MAALLISLSIMALALTAVMPVWKQTSQREKEAELVFRGTQYVHAIQLFQRKSGPGTYPPSVDLLVEQKFLRKKYKDPITNGDFQPLPAAMVAAPPGATQGAVPRRKAEAPRAEMRREDRRPRSHLRWAAAARRRSLAASPGS